MTRAHDCKFCQQPMPQHRPVGEYEVCPGAIGPGERYEAGVRGERARIVAWLRNGSDCYAPDVERQILRLADAIESSVHLNRGEGEGNP